jgi:hypothetical protein
MDSSICSTHKKIVVKAKISTQNFLKNFYCKSLNKNKNLKFN